MKKYLIGLCMLCGLFLLIGCKEETSTTSTSNSTTTTTEGEEPASYEYKMELPSTELLTTTTGRKVEGAPDLMILGMVADTISYFHYETMSAYEYIKVYNNTSSDYNMKNHRVVLAYPMQGQNYEAEGALSGNSSLCIGYLFSGLVDEDFIIPSFSIGLLWLKPYYWTAGTGSNAFNKPFSSALVHKDAAGVKGAFSQTIDDFEEFWELEADTMPIYALTNMSILGKRPADGGTEDMFPIMSPGAGSGFTHLNTTLLRSIEIQKFNTQDGKASLNLLNKYETLSEEKKADPDPIYTKKIFNVMAIQDPSNPQRDENNIVDGYYYENVWKYFDPIVRINFCGRVDVNGLALGQEKVSFDNTSNTGIKGFDNTAEFVFRPPVKGERIMRWQLPLRELDKYTKYMDTNQLKVMRFFEENIKDYRYIQKTILFSKDPSDMSQINWKTDEIKSTGRMSCANPKVIFDISLTA